MLTAYENSLKGKRIAVIGGGVTGEALVRYLKSINLLPFVFDEKNDEVAGIATHSNLHDAHTIDLAIVSPGWKKSHPIITSLVAADIEVMSEIDFAWKVKMEKWPDQRWVAITGTNGKTTTTQMLDSIFEVSTTTFRGAVCGNVGKPVIDIIGGDQKYDVLALELSSFQIEWSSHAHYFASAILNIAEDHVDWHGSFDEYAKAKIKLLAQSDMAILNAEDVEVVTRSSAIELKKIFYSLQTPIPGEIGLVENLLVDRAFVPDPMHAESFAELTDIQPTVPHNVSNACAAAGLALALGISHEDIRNGLRAFVVDHHRMENVLQRDGITWINDSKATNPHAASASILGHHNVVWIAGGLAKGADMQPLVKRVAKRLKKVILIGEDASVIERALQSVAPDIPVHHVSKTGTTEDFMDRIVEMAHAIAENGDVVLLAPACASMDQFISYSQRGSLFADSVRRIVGKQ